MPCPDEETLAAALENRLDPEARRALEVHLETCDSCRAAMVGLARMERSSTATEPGQSPPAPELPLNPAQTYGRFIVLARIGRGGMGEVFEAYDPVLRRHVALKLMHAQGGNGALLREAMAMAKVSHPNVVGVYDVGEVEGRVFIAMEHIDGANLRLWLSTRPRSAREVLRVLSSVGRGLAELHRVGLTHRDVKPENILVSNTGRAWLADLGLSSVQRVDGIAGTRAYMAPEQLKGAPAEPASDQYAFCLTLKEALGETASRRVRTVLQRGLAENPKERFPSLDTLVDTLTPRSRWLPLGLATAALSFALGAAALQAFSAQRARTCTAGVAAAAGAVWNSARADRRAALR